MLLIIGTIRLPEAKLADARMAMRAMIDGSRAEAGCLDYSYAEDVLDPGLIRVTEIWRDQAALDRHFASDHLRAWRAVWSDFGIGNRDLMVYDAGEPGAV